MTRSRTARAAGLALLATAPLLAASAQYAPQGAVVLTPDEMKWEPVAAPRGAESAVLVGSRTAPGPYTVRVRFPANFVHQPHTHPDARIYTVISGTLHVGFGERLEEAKLKALPPGSFWTEPANVAHFVVTRGEPVVFQIAGTSPTRTSFVDPAHDPQRR